MGKKSKKLRKPPTPPKKKAASLEPGVDVAKEKKSYGMKLFYIESEGDEVYISDEDLVPIQDLWGPCFVGCFTGRFPGLNAIQRMVDGWGVRCQILPHHRGWVVFKFLTEEDRVRVVVKEKKEINNKKMMINILDESFFMWDVRSFTTMPVWVKMLDVPMQFWTPKGLSHIGSKLGTPMYIDGITQNLASMFTRPTEEDNELKYLKFNFCRMLINMDLSAKPPTSIKVNYEGGDYQQKIEYEDMPQYCYHCESLGHNPFNCKILHELHKKQFQEEQKIKERDRVETLKATLMAQAKAEQDAGRNQGRGKAAGNKDGERNDAEIEKTNPTVRGDKGKKVLSSEDEPSPSFTEKGVDVGFTEVGKGTGFLTTHPLEAKGGNRDRPPRQGKGGQFGQSNGGRGGSGRGRGRGLGP